MMAEMHDIHMFKRNLLRVRMFRMMLETFRELFELRLRELLQMFNATTADEAGVILTDEQNDFLFADASRMEVIEELSANICLMAKIQPANIDSDAGPCYDYAFLSKNVKQKTHANADVRAQNQDLLFTISELKAELKTVENVTLQTSPNKQQAEGTKKNVIALGMYKVGTSQVTNTNKAKSVLTSTRLSATSSVRRPSDRDSSFKNSFVSNTKNSSMIVEVSNWINKKPDVAYKNFGLDTFVTNDEIKNALIAKNVICVSYAKNVLIPCHETVNLIYILSPFPIWLLLHPFVLCPKLLRQSHGYGTATLLIRYFGSINDLTKHELVDGLLKFKYGKDHLCFACERGKSKKASHPPKLVLSSHSQFVLFHIDVYASNEGGFDKMGKKNCYCERLIDYFSIHDGICFLHSKR
ncbi:hypothetical protein Tco_1547031 [Tanacetum coccineum]